MHTFISGYGDGVCVQQLAECDTAAALKITGISPMNWRVSVDKGFYTAAPPTTGMRRVWDVDAMVCLAWYDALCTSGMKRPMAGGLAAELKAAIERDPTATSFGAYAWADADGERGRLSIGPAPPAEAPNAPLIMVMPLDLWRSRVRTAMDIFLQRKAARHAK